MTICSNVGDSGTIAPLSKANCMSSFLSPITRTDKNYSQFDTLRHYIPRLLSSRFDSTQKIKLHITASIINSRLNALFGYKNWSRSLSHVAFGNRQTMCTSIACSKFSAVIEKLRNLHRRPIKLPYSFDVRNHLLYTLKTLKILLRLDFCYIYFLRKHLIHLTLTEIFL